MLKYVVWFFAALASLFYGLFRVRGAQLDNIKAKSENRNLKSKIRRKTIVEAAEEARIKAATEGQKLVENDIDSAKRGARRRFD